MLVSKKLCKRVFKKISVDKFVCGILCKSSWMRPLCTLSHSVCEEMSTLCSSEIHHREMTTILCGWVLYYYCAFSDEMISFCAFCDLLSTDDAFLTRSCCVWDDGLQLVMSDVIACVTRISCSAVQLMTVAVY